MPTIAPLLQAIVSQSVHFSRNKVQKKVLICLFTCMSVRAVH